MKYFVSFYKDILWTAMEEQMPTQQHLTKPQTYDFVPSVMRASGKGMTCAYTVGNEFWSQHQLEDGRVVFFKWENNPYPTDSK